ncbi:hypothetical protein E4U44_000966 [Claviceps purpurea]|nr:hypothetical protein E4U44_000966 [Claviceps purpurea]
MSISVTQQISAGNDTRAGNGHVPSGKEGGVVEPSEPLNNNDTKKKKGKGGRKSLASRGPCALPRNRGTGFEEFFADPPLTPEEAAEESLEVYASCVPFEERIQACIQRFRSRRRLQGDQPVYFNEYLFLGGIDTKQNSFAGLDNKDLKDLTPAEQRDATARDTVHICSGANEQFYNGDTENWSVDFAGVAAGFFSITLGQLSGFETQKFETGISIVESFLRYVLQHGVCPEYQDNVQSALRVCQQARQEWPMLRQFGKDLPGQFSLAAAECFSTSESEDWSLLSFTRPEDFDVKAVFLASCTLCGEMEAVHDYARGKLAVKKQFTRTVKVTDVQRPSDALIDKFASLCIQGISRAVEPVGKLYFEDAVIEDERGQAEMPELEKGSPLWVYLEDRLLANVVPGMKMEIKFVELTTGIRFVKSVLNLVPSFYTFLPQQMMKHYKTLRDNDRPAPSVRNPVAEEEQVSRENE